MTIITHVWQLIQHGDSVFSIDIKDAYLYIPVVSYNLFGTICLIIGKFYLLGCPWVFNALTKSILFLCHHKSFCIVIYLDDILVLVCLRWAGKSAPLFLCSLLVRIGLHINFSKSDLCLTQTFCFLGLCWDTVCMSASLALDKLVDIQQIALSLLQSQCDSLYGHVLFR